MPHGRGSARRVERDLPLLRHVNDLESTERFLERMDIDRVHAALDGDQIVGGTGAFTYRMSVPGGAVPAAGVTIVGVLPSHRRRGVLTALMRDQLEDCRARGEAAAYLWASEATIYPRFGYGVAALMGDMSLARERTRVRTAVRAARHGSARRRRRGGANRSRRSTSRSSRSVPASSPRSQAWWEGRRFVPAPWEPKALKRLALLEMDGEPAGYAIYIVSQEWAHGSSAGKVSVIEAVSAGARGDARALALAASTSTGPPSFEAAQLPLDHPLFLLLARAPAHAVRSRGRDLGAADRRRSCARRPELRGGHAGRRRAVRRVPAGERWPVAAWSAWGRADERGGRGGPRRLRARLCLPRRLLVFRPRARFAGDRAGSGAVRRADELFEQTCNHGARKFSSLNPSRQQALRRLQSLFWGRKILWRTKVPSAHGSGRGLGREGKT